MISKKIILRENPLFEFEFNEEGLQVTDASKDNTSRFYKYDLIKEPTHQSKSINWFATLLNFFGLAIGFSHKKAIQTEGFQIRFKYGKEMVIILTENCEVKNIVEISEIIKSNISILNTKVLNTK